MQCSAATMGRWGCRLLLAAIATGTVPFVSGHGSLVRPASRNALLDRSLPAFAGGRAPAVSCNCGDARAGCREGSRAPGGGQSCFWFSQGCFIGCRLCTGTDRQGDGMPLNVSANGADCSGARGGLSDQPAGFSESPTLPKRLWTMNLAAVEDSPQDIYRFHPFRAPGSGAHLCHYSACNLSAIWMLCTLPSSIFTRGGLTRGCTTPRNAAPVTDPCGTAGGTGPAHRGPGEAIFSPVPTRNGSSTIRQGALGSKVLPRGPPTATWRVSSVNSTAVEVSWAMRIKCAFPAAKVSTLSVSRY
jgi:hypothetical protein